MRGRLHPALPVEGATQAPLNNMAIGDYLDENKEAPYCKGCGHIHIDKGLARALDLLSMDPGKVAVVSDIGCMGLVDSMLKTHTVHTTHGRSPAFAAGIELADAIYGDSALKTIVMIGDGGATIGLLHLVELARMNPDVTVLIHNNFLYGMTGGQHSGFTPVNFITSTTREGSIIPPIDICGILATCKAGFLARVMATDHKLPEVIAQAISYPGFALVEILELCTGYSTRFNPLIHKEMKADLKKQGRHLGILNQDQDKKEFAISYKERSHPAARTDQRPEEGIPRLFSHQLTAPLRLIMGGTAGEGVQSAAHLFSVAAVLSGLFTAQKNDNPVTVGTGFSTSELIFSPDEILFSGISVPDATLITSGIGLKRLEGMFIRMNPEGLAVVEADLTIPQVPGRILRTPFRGLIPDPQGVNLAAVAAYLKQHPFLPIDALKEAIRRRGKGVEEAILAVELGFNRA